MFGSRMTIGIGATLWCLVCGGGAVAGPFVPAALAQASAAAEGSGSGNATGPRELASVRGLPVVEVAGPLCQTLAPSLARVETRPGGHRIPGGEGRAVADLILAAAR